MLSAHRAIVLQIQKVEQAEQGRVNVLVHMREQASVESDTYDHNVRVEYQLQDSGPSGWMLVSCTDMT